MKPISNADGRNQSRAGASRPRWRTTLLAAAAAVAATLATASFTPSASAAVSCSQAGTAVTVTFTAYEDDATFLRGPGREILVNGAQCGTATTENTETVTIIGTVGESEYVFIDLAGGPFVSLQRETSPPSGTSVQFQVDLGADRSDELFIDGTAAADTFIAGTNGITLDQSSPPGELDVVLPTAIGRVHLHGRGEGDFLSSAGDNTTGAPVADPVYVRFFGEEGNDVLVGFDNSVFYPGPGDDSMAGQNTAGLNLGSAPGPVKVDLATGTATGEGNDTFSGVTRMWGSPFADELIGNGANNYLNGYGGSDVIRGRAGNDFIFGSDGNDDLDGETGSDTYIDYYEYNYTTDDDTIADSGAGAADKDIADFFEAAGPVSVDLAAGTASGVGTDTLAGIESVVGTDAADTLLGSPSGETLEGSGGADLLGGGGGADALWGGAGDDLLRPGAGDDTADGGPGVNTLAFDQATKGVIVSLAAATASGDGADTFTGVQRVRGSAFVDVLRGSGAVDALFGLGGADTLVGGGGADLLDGGSGRDTADYATAPSAVTVDLATGKAARGAGADTLLGLENVDGSAFADLLRGSTGANLLRGGGGGDILEGRGGTDDLQGGNGGDLVRPGAGDDSADGGAGVDTLAFDQAPNGVHVSLAAGTATGEGADTSAAIERVRGSAFADVLRGSGAVEALFGLGGADTLVGGAGADLLQGGSGRDTAGYATAPSAVTVDLGTGKAARGAGADTLIGLENVDGSAFADLLRGSPGFNLLRGGGGGDTLRGATGSDRLYGMSGSDLLYGGNGRDALYGGNGRDLLIGGPGRDGIRQ